MKFLDIDEVSAGELSLTIRSALHISRFVPKLQTTPFWNYVLFVMNVLDQIDEVQF